MGSGPICSQWSKDKPASGAGVLENLAGKLSRAVCKGVFMRGDERGRHSNSSSRVIINTWFGWCPRKRGAPGARQAPVMEALVDVPSGNFFP